MKIVAHNSNFNDICNTFEGDTIFGVDDNNHLSFNQEHRRVKIVTFDGGKKIVLRHAETQKISLLSNYCQDGRTHCR